MNPFRRSIRADVGVAAGGDLNLSGDASVCVNSFSIEQLTLVLEGRDQKGIDPETLARIIENRATSEDHEQVARQLDDQADLERGLARLAVQAERRDTVLEAWPPLAAKLPDTLIEQAAAGQRALVEARFVQAEMIVTESLVDALRQSDESADRALEARWLELAGEICRADFRYRSAAERFARAAERLPDPERARRPALRWREARAWLDSAWEFGDVDAAERARERLQVLAAYDGRQLPTRDRLRIELELGEAYLRLARLRGEPPALEEARVILAHVVENAKQAQGETLLKIDAEAYLGLALHWLGEWTADAGASRNAVAKFKAARDTLATFSSDAIEHASRRRVRSTLNHQLGLALTRLGEREDGDAGVALLDEAITTLDCAIADREEGDDDDEIRDHRGWAESRNARLVAVMSKAERVGDTGLLWQASAEAEEVLKHRPRKRVPLQWAATEANRGNALAALARQTGKRQRWRDAVAAYRAALECFERDKTPFDWATTSGNLGIALLHIAKNAGNLVDAERILAEASAVLSTERAPIQYGIILNTLGGCRAMLADTRGDRAAMEDARATFEQAAATFSAAGADTYRRQAEANIEEAGQSLAAMA
ncbi:MAG: hypothetical protein GVY33_17120 [Alphaproteobacteria bacterium]|jgi:hypothetical protein|nr:hypothetical protein [Alphaproteobacteria bacterium]